MTSRENEHPHELISAYLDGEAASSERQMVEMHLRGCAECRTLLDDLRRLALAASAEIPPPVPAGLAARIRWRLPRQEPKRGEVRRRPWWRAPLPLSAAASLVLAVCVVWMLRGELRLAQGQPELRASKLLIDATVAQEAPDAPQGSGVDERVRQPSGHIQELFGQETVSSASDPETTKGEVESRTALAAVIPEDLGEAVLGEVSGDELSERKDATAKIPLQRMKLRKVEKESRRSREMTGQREEQAAPEPKVTSYDQPTPAEQPQSSRRVSKEEPVDEARIYPEGTRDQERYGDLQILGRSYADLMTLAPGVTDTDGDGNLNVRGAREVDFSVRTGTVRAGTKLKESAAFPMGAQVIVEFPDHHIAISDTGLISIKIGDYACSVQVEGETPSEARMESPAKPRAISSIFALAASLESHMNDEVSGAVEHFQTAGFGESARRITLQDAAGQTVRRLHYAGTSVPPPAAEIERRLLGLVRERYRNEIEKACGPLPQLEEASD